MMMMMIDLVKAPLKNAAATAAASVKSIRASIFRISSFDLKKENENNTFIVVVVVIIVVVLIGAMGVYFFEEDIEKKNKV